jgi:spore coat polysaccharide biosynthesis protein SpsF
MSLHLIIQARMNSSRLPGKVLKTVLGKTLLEYQIERLTRVKKADKIIVATTVNSIDDAIIDLCDRLNIPTYRGSESDVLSRYAVASQQFDSQTIVRITSDCPLIDPGLIDRAIEFYQSNHFDYVSTDEDVYPRGMDVEIFSGEMLQIANLNAEKPDEREHVTPHFYQNPEQFSIGTYSEPIQAANYRLTVDTPEDFQLIQLLLENLYPKNSKFNLDDILECLTEHPGWNKINQHIQQKSLQECVR